MVIGMSEHEQMILGGAKYSAHGLFEPGDQVENKKRSSIKTLRKGGKRKSKKASKRTTV